MYKLYKEYIELLEAWEDIDSDSLDDEESKKVVMKSKQNTLHIGRYIRDWLVEHNVSFDNFELIEPFAWNGLRFQHTSYLLVDIYVCIGGSNVILSIYNVYNGDRIRSRSQFIPNLVNQIAIEDAKTIIQNSLNVIHENIDKG